MFYCVCLECGRSQPYDGPEDNRCPACWGKTSIFCPNCSTYLKDRPTKKCPYCDQPFVQPVTTAKTPA